MSETGSLLPRRRTFGTRRLVPRACVVDARRHVRRLLCDALTELGFVAGDFADADDLFGQLDTAAPDLIIAAADPTTTVLLQRLADEAYDRHVMIFGARGSLALAELQRRATALGLAVLDGLGTPFRGKDLVDRLAPLLPPAPPPRPQVDVGEALHSEWLELWYQPTVDPRTLRVHGAEALIRMRHPAWGIIRPADFLPAPGDRHFRALADFVLARATADWVWLVTEGVTVEMSINLPIAVLDDPRFVDRIRLQLPVHPAFDRLVIEIEGSTMLRDHALARDVAQQLRLYNVGLSIDDLGSEWRRLLSDDDCPFVEIKVDRQLVQGAADDRLKRAACDTVVDVARRLGLRTVAKGVETRADFQAARDIGFDLVQGFLFGQPLELPRFARAMREWRGEVPG